jgi:6-phosphogluconolactonase
MPMNRKMLPWLVMASGISAFPVLAQNATDYDLLVGSYTQGKSEGIYRYRFDSHSGRIDLQPRQVLKGSAPPVCGQ